MDSHSEHLNTLAHLNRHIQSIVSNAYAMDGTCDAQDPWEVAYNLVFSDAISREVYTTLRAMGQRLDYYAPDTSYEEDVQAFANAVSDKFSVLEQLLENGPTPY